MGLFDQMKAMAEAAEKAAAGARRPCVVTGRLASPGLDAHPSGPPASSRACAASARLNPS